MERSSGRLLPGPIVGSQGPIAIHGGLRFEQPTDFEDLASERHAQTIENAALTRLMQSSSDLQCA